jgi:peptide/nickel transport system substrate-binding protein
VLLALVLVASCAPGPTPSAGGVSGAQDSTPPQAPKRIVAAIRSNPSGLYAKLTTGRFTSASIEQLVNVGLTTLGDSGELHPRLAETVPTTENGLWVVEPDGRMTVTWVIRDGARWHDGTPFTTQDLLFTAALVQDERLPAFGDAKYRFLEGVEARDARTITARWKQPFIEADQLFSSVLTMPLPKHLLERAYLEDAAQLTDQPYWSQEFVGTGPYRLKEWTLGSHLVVEADPRYLLGRPKIDSIEVRFITESVGLAASVLAGAVEITLGTTGLSLEQAIEVRERWREGRVETTPASLRRIHPQLINPNPPVIADVTFRRGLLHAIDRQELIDTLEGGLTTVPASFLPPNRPEFREVEAGVTRYPYDPRRSTELIESLGYTRGADGSFRDASQQRLNVELRTAAGDDNQNKIMFSVADYWQRAGVGVEPTLLPVQLSSDRQVHASRPGFHLSGGTSSLPGLGNLTSAQVPRAENNWVGSNTARYASAEYDALYDRYLTTIPQRERTAALARLIEHLAVNLPVLPIYYRVAPSMLANRVTGVGPEETFRDQAWNAHEWDIRS